MSGVKHTPGPWELVSLSGYGAPFSIRMPYIATTANVGQTHYGVQSVRRREDAILIAAAPDLLEALTEARLTLSLTRTNIMVEMKKSEGAAYRWEGVPELLANRIAQCDAAINRATGDRPEKGEQQ